MRHCSLRAALLLIVLVSPAALRTAEACSSMPNPPCSAAWKAEAVFIATAVENVEEHLGGHLFWTVQRFLVTRALRGTARASVTMVPMSRPGEEQIAAWAGANSCGYQFRLGEEYLVYGTRAADGRWTTTLCSGTKPLADAQADLEYFAGPSATDPTGRVYGSIQRTIFDADDPTKTAMCRQAG
jgi:hypothetical protein